MMMMKKPNSIVKSYMEYRAAQTSIVWIVDIEFFLRMRNFNVWKSKQNKSNNNDRLVVVGLNFIQSKTNIRSKTDGSFFLWRNLTSNCVNKRWEIFSGFFISFLDRYFFIFGFYCLWVFEKKNFQLCWCSKENKSLGQTKYQSKQNKQANIYPTNNQKWKIFQSCSSSSV